MTRWTLVTMAGILALASTTSVTQTPGPKATSPAAKTTTSKPHPVTGGSQASQEHESANVQITALRKSRVETLTELVAEYKVLAQAGRVDFDFVVAAQNDLIEAKLDLATKPEERVALATEKMKLAEAYWKRTKNRFLAIKATKADLLRARAFLLGSEINLSQERMTAGLPAPENLPLPADGLPWRMPTVEPEPTKSRDQP